MDVDTEDNINGGPPVTSEHTPPDDEAEYMLFVVDDGQRKGTTSTTSLRAKLDQVRKAALELSEGLTKNYIWQRDAFNLQAVHQKGLVYLRGVTSYGECVEDEWLIVYILREISKSFPDVWIRVCDNDGEFLLVEAAKAVPKWLNPEADANRIWIHGGQLKIIPLQGFGDDSGPGPAPPSSRPSITLTEAVQIIKKAPTTLLHIPTLEEEAFYRLQKYPDHVTDSLYHTRLILPRKIAYILHDRPRSIAPAVEAFSLRDPITTKKVFGSKHPEKSLHFSPIDLVVISVKFTRVLYAQLRGQRFTPPNGWPAIFAAFMTRFQSKEDEVEGKGKEQVAAYNDKLNIMLEVSMKVTCGFELMASSSITSNNRIVREVGIILEDLSEDGDDRIVLPSDEDIQKWKDFDRDDDDSWLNIDFDDFERELDSKRRQTGGMDFPNSGFGDSGVQTDLRRIVSQFQAFLNDDDAGIEGAEFDEMDEDNDDDEDGEDDSEEDGEGVHFNEEEFSRLMREMMGLPRANSAASTKSPPVQTTEPTNREHTNKATPTSLSGRNENDTDEENILSLAAQFEAELKGHGALKLDTPKKGKEATSTTKEITADKQPRNSAGEDDAPESGSDGEVDVDFNLAKNLLESFKGQEGLSGPAGNILSMLGMALPRDDDDDEAGHQAL